MILRIVLTAALAALALPAVALEDWAAEGGDESGVLGMSAAELDDYAASQGEGPQADDEKPQAFVRGRRRFVMREFKFNSDWDTDPTSLPAMVEQFKRLTGMDAQAMQPRQPLTMDAAELTDWPFVFMTAHNAFTLSEADIASLRTWLERGGFLHADDCLYGFPFGPAFHGEMRKVFPEQELRPIPVDKPELANLMRQKYAMSDNEAGLPKQLGTNPFEFMDVGGRMAVLYTPPDIGCFWEISTPPTPSNPLGGGMHNMGNEPRAVAYRMGVNIIFYA
ncbi:MAG TPA: DUF4159 domain-containing protein, partial [Planctomycetota bacterium]|nr:DUF4159 domain-containing protein [Planctomycetota bacterium]